MVLDEDTYPDLERLGLTQEQALTYANAAAPYTDPNGNGNRRYESFVFDIEGGVVYMISLIGDAPPEEDLASNCNDDFEVERDCPACGGSGELCMDCSGTGKVTL